MSPRARRPTGRSILVVLLLASSVALAAVSPLLIAIAWTGTTLSVATNSLPKGWFANGNNFDRAKTLLQTEVTAGATACSTGGTVWVSSGDAGTFTAVMNGGQNTNGWTWATGVELSGYQNHWFTFFRCDSSVEVRGCAAAVPVTVTTTAYSKSGACHQYVNDAGATVCAADTRSTSLPAVQDPDVIETPCLEVQVEEECGIGVCQSVCQGQCNTQGYVGTSVEQQDARQACHDACECQCMLEIRTETECNMPAKCYQAR